jgi:hypothetical protein
MNYETKAAFWRFAQGWNGEGRMGKRKKKVHAEARRGNSYLTTEKTEGDFYTTD